MYRFELADEILLEGLNVHYAINIEKFRQYGKILQNFRKIGLLSRVIAFFQLLGQPPLYELF